MNAQPNNTNDFPYSAFIAFTICILMTAIAMTILPTMNDLVFFVGMTASLICLGWITK